MKAIDHAVAQAFYQPIGIAKLTREIEETDRHIGEMRRRYLYYLRISKQFNYSRGWAYHKMLKDHQFQSPWDRLT